MRRNVLKVAIKYSARYLDARPRLLNVRPHNYLESSFCPFQPLSFTQTLNRKCWTSNIIALLAPVKSLYTILIQLTFKAIMAYSMFYVYVLISVTFSYFMRIAM